MAWRMRPTFKSWFKERWKKKVVDGGGVLTKYVLDKSRTKLLGPDQLLFVDEYETRRLGIEWRRNRLFQRLKCPVCGESFNRGHMKRCGFTEQMQNNGLEDEVLKLWEQEELEMCARSRADGWTYNGNYTVLDTLLNNKLYDKFAQWANWLDRLLRK
jgi:hypothetical protein